MSRFEFRYCSSFFLPSFLPSFLFLPFYSAAVSRCCFSKLNITHVIIFKGVGDHCRLGKSSQRRFCIRGRILSGLQRLEEIWIITFLLQPRLSSTATATAKCFINISSLWSLGQEDPLKKEMATHSSILAWEIPWTEEPGGLQSMGLQRARHDQAHTNTHTHIHIHIPTYEAGAITLQVVWPGYQTGKW